jgi:hypothetical protein
MRKERSSPPPGVRPRVEDEVSTGPFPSTLTLPPPPVRVRQASFSPDPSLLPSARIEPPPLLPLLL